MGYLEIEKNELYLCFWLEKGQEARLLKTASGKRNWDPEHAKCRENCRIIEILTPGNLNYSYRGARSFYDVPQVKLEYTEHEWKIQDGREILLIRQKGGGMEAETSFCFYPGIPVFSCESCVRNTGGDEIWLDGITSFSYGNADYYQKGKHDPGKNLQISYAYNTWSAECRWVRKQLWETGICSYGNLCYDRFRIENHTDMSSGEYLPEGALYNCEEDETIAWQIENSGAWAWELGCVAADYQKPFMEKEYEQSICLQLYGPQMEGAFWQKRLLPGESFRTVPAAVAVCRGKTEEGFTKLTEYRRTKKRITKLPVIFNDYMNALMGSSSTELLKPYIEKAAEAGCEIFVVDCGWYDAGNWQFTFGTFEECPERYPHGLREVMDRIRAHGMKPGLWLELESFGVDNKRACELPKDWLFCRHGKPLIDSGRYHLDFRNAEVRSYASGIVARVVEQYGLSYLKIDYNLCIGWGTDQDSDSLGDGLLSHSRAYLSWLEEEMKKYPEVIWENCASGGLRMDYALLSRMDIQSVSDQEDYRKMAVIAANSAAAVLPEQAGIWAYPRREGTEDETIVNMVSALLFRIHLGGHLPELSGRRFRLVQEAVRCYKSIRDKIPCALPYWPLGFHTFDAGWLCWGMHGKEEDFIAVVRRDAKTKELYIPVRRKVCRARIVYPLQGSAQISSSREKDITVCLENTFSACLIEII